MKWLDFYKGKKVLLAGHTGFKGTWMTAVLLRAGAKVTGYALESKISPNLFDLCKFSENLNSNIADIKIKQCFSERKTGNCYPYGGTAHCPGILSFSCLYV